jgi:protein SCO1
MMANPVGPTPPSQASPHARTRAGLTRRHGLLLLAAALGRPTAAQPARPATPGTPPHFPFGPLPVPRALPVWPVQTHRGQATDLAALCRGRTTALQLMFTSCSATCPIQGALFAQAQSLLMAQSGGSGRLQLLSLTIDPLSDDPAALAAWLRRHGAGPFWRAARPRLADRDTQLAFFNRDALAPPSGSDPHTTQVHLIDRQGRLVYRTPALPPAEQIASLLRRIDQTG